MSTRITSAEYRRMMGVSPAVATSVKQMARGLTAHRAGSMNKTEAQYRDHLESRQRAGEIAWFKFEALKLRLADKTFLTPDFLVMLPDGLLELHEVKGMTVRTDSSGNRVEKAYYRDDSIAKLKIAAEIYPFCFFLAFPSKQQGWIVRSIATSSERTA